MKDQDIKELCNGFGVGIWNDAISLVGAASFMISILLGGLRSFGFA